MSSLASLLLKTRRLEKVEINEFKSLQCREEKDSIQVCDLTVLVISYLVINPVFLQHLHFSPQSLDLGDSEAIVTSVLKFQFISLSDHIAGRLHVCYFISLPFRFW